MNTTKLNEMTLTKIVQACLRHGEQIRNPAISNSLKEKHKKLNHDCATVAKVKFSSLREADKLKLSKNDGLTISLASLYQSGL